MDFDLASLAMNADPMQRQKLLAQIARTRSRDADQEALAQAGAQSRQYDQMAAVAPLLNNKMVERSALSAQKSAGNFAPTQLGNTGFMLPGSGQFVESPMYADEKDAQRQLQRDLTSQRLDTTRDVAADRLAVQKEANANKYALGTIMAEIARARVDAARATADDKRTRAAEKDDEKKAAADEKAVDAGVQKLSAFADKKQLPRLVTSTRKVLDKIAAAGDKDVPGLSLKDQTLLNAPFGKSMMSDDAIDTATSYQSVLNALTRADAGLSQTQGEVLRQALETLNSPTSNSRARKLAFSNVATLVEEIRGATLGSGNDKVREKYRANMANVGGDSTWMDPLPVKPKAAPRAAPAAPAPDDTPRGGVDANTWKHMTPEERKLFK